MAEIHGIEFVIKGNSDSASDSISQLIQKLNSLKRSLSSTSGTNGMSQSIKKVGEEAKKQSHHTNQFFSSILRIAKYRMIRSALKAITQAFSEGLKNAYMFSKGIGGDLAEALDTLKTKSMTMKNQMGAAFGGLITAITPVVVQIIKLVNTLAAAITRLIAILGGKSTWLRARENWTEWGEAASGAGGAAKEALRYLAPFDELNRLPDENSGGGGGGGGDDFSNMFEEVSVDIGAGFLDAITEAFNKLTEWIDDQSWQELGAKFWETIKGLFSSSEEADSVVSAFFEALGAAFGAVLGFAWGFIKEAVGDLIKSFKDNLIDYDGDDKIGLLDVLTACWETVMDIGDWIDDNIINPFLKGIQQGFIDGDTEPLSWNDFWDHIFIDLLGLPPLDIDTLLGALFANFGSGTASTWIENKLIPWITDGLEDFANEVSILFTGMDLVDLGEWIDELIQDGKDIANGLLEGFSEVWDDIKTWANENIWTPLCDAVKSVFGIASPATTMKPLGNDIANGLLEGIISIFTNLDAWVQEHILDPLQNGIENGKELVANVKAKVSEWVLDAKTKVIDGMKAMFTSWAKKSGEFKSTMSNMVAEFTNRVKGKTFKSTLGNMIAEFTSNSKGRGFASTISNMVAEFTSRTKGSTFKSTLGNMVAEFVSHAKSTNFSNAVTGLLGYLSGAYAGWDALHVPAVSIIAALINPYWKNGTPTMTVNASVGGHSGHSGNFAKGGALYGGAWHRIPQYAKGTTNAHGSLFLAGEAGAELVGHIGGRTEVLNRSQLAATMFAAVRSAIASTGFRVSGVSSVASGATPDDGMNEETLYRAMLRALNDSDLDRPIELDGNSIYKSVVKRNRLERQRTGMNPMLSY